MPGGLFIVVFLLLSCASGSLFLTPSCNKSFSSYKLIRNVMAHRCARKGKLRVNRGMEWVTQLLERERQVIACHILPSCLRAAG
jgi:hypothetical protein